MANRFKRVGTGSSSAPPSIRLRPPSSEGHTSLGARYEQVQGNFPLPFGPTARSLKIDWVYLELSRPAEREAYRIGYEEYILGILHYFRNLETIRAELISTDGAMSLPMLAAISQLPALRESTANAIGDDTHLLDMGPILGALATLRALQLDFACLEMLLSALVELTGISQLTVRGEFNSSDQAKRNILASFKSVTSLTLCDVRIELPTFHAVLDALSGQLVSLRFRPYEYPGESEEVVRASDDLARVVKHVCLVWNRFASRQISGEPKSSGSLRPAPTSEASIPVHDVEVLLKSNVGSILTHVKVEALWPFDRTPEEERARHVPG